MVAAMQFYVRTYGFCFGRFRSKVGSEERYSAFLENYTVRGGIYYKGSM